MTTVIPIPCMITGASINHSPYIAGFSEKLAKDLKPIHIGLTFQKGRTIYNLVCKLKPLKHPDDRKNEKIKKWTVNNAKDFKLSIILAKLL